VRQRSHLNRRLGGFESLVAHLQSGAVDRLLQIFAGEDAERVWHPGFLRGLSDAARDLVDDNVVVGGVSAQQATDANDGIVFPCFRKSAGGRRDFKRTGHTNDMDIFLYRAGAQQSVVGALQQSLRDEGIEARDDNRKALAQGAEPTLQGGELRFRRKLSGRG
jgi:hypothetical protein